MTPLANDMHVCRVAFSRWAWRWERFSRCRSSPMFTVTVFLQPPALAPSAARILLTPELQRRPDTGRHFPVFSARPRFVLRLILLFATERDVPPACLRAAPPESLAAVSPFGKKKRRSVQEPPALRIRLLFIYRLHKQVNTGGAFLPFAPSRVSRSVAAESSPARVHARSEALQFSIS